MRTIELYLTCFLLIACGGPKHQEIPNLTRVDHIVENEELQLFVREIFIPNLVKFDYPLLLIHGGGPGAVASFDLPVEGGSFALDLARKGFKVYLMNIRGWGSSTAPAYPLHDSTIVAGSHQEAASDIASVVDWIIDREPYGKVSLFGWATGGHWAAYYTTLNPEKVAHLLSLNSLYGVQAPWHLRHALTIPNDSTKFDHTRFGTYRKTPKTNLTNRWKRSIPMDELAEWTDPAVMTAYTEEAIAHSPAKDTFMVPGGYRIESFNMANGIQYWNARDLVVPTLIIRSKLDFWSRKADLIAIRQDLINVPRRAIANIAGTHYVFLDKPDRGRHELIQRIVEFIEN